jgi:hypothetical protein
VGRDTGAVPRHHPDTARDDGDDGQTDRTRHAPFDERRAGAAATRLSSQIVLQRNRKLGRSVSLAVTDAVLDPHAQAFSPPLKAFHPSRPFSEEGTMIRIRLSRLAAACAVVVMAASPARADLSVRLTNAQLTATSDVIVIGRAATSQSRWIDRALVTAVIVQVEESLKGGVSGGIEVLLPGGRDASRRVKVAMTYPGAPTLRGDEQVFLFLTRSDEVGGYIVSGFAQGKFSIITDGTGVRRVSRDLRGSRLIEGTGISRGTVTLEPLATFRQDILALIAQ